MPRHFVDLLFKLPFSCHSLVFNLADFIPDGLIGVTLATTELGYALLFPSGQVEF